ncbi:formyl transferase [Stachybotrys elegans]|uniref:Phosphoribosylglycinamide formyltransferase n=1 Tax=Stachybotrys elegans TaxID=80388 RepID=A0A8K0SRC8_9HYPO|nr:formyl transferase [Stachybotrys elegans]
MSGNAEAPRCRILVMASGNGSNFEALIEGVNSGRIANSEIIRLIVNRGKAYAIQRAANHGIPSENFNLVTHKFQAKGEKDPQKLQEARDKYDAALAEKILGLEVRPHLIVLAGWMHILSPGFLKPLAEAGILLINLHPALPGMYDGAEALERAYADFEAGKLKDNKTGIMVHYVIEEVDRGAPILVKEIECREGEELEQFKERVHSHEHQLIVDATAKVAGEIVAKGL